MKLTAGEVYDAQTAIAAIINRPRQIPQIAKYRFARLYSALAPACDIMDAKRGEIMQRLGSEIFADDAKTQSKGWGVIPGTPAAEAYVKELDVIRAEVLEVNVEPITLESLGNEIRGIEADEFKNLGPFIVESAAAVVPA